MNTMTSCRRLVSLLFLPFALLASGVSGSGAAGAAEHVPPAAERAARIDAFIDKEMKKLHIPGVALAVLSEGRILYGKGYGLANLEHQVPVKTETVFQSGSTGKQYTAMAVLMLVEEGKLKLDESIRTYFPDAPETWRPMTVRHLLTHTSGLGDYPATTDLRKDLSEKELREFVYQQKLGFPPGEKFAYSNMAYAVLGTLVSQACGRFYGDFLQERIFRPLDMKTARIISESDIVPNRAAGYLWNGQQWKNQGWVSPSFNSTADGSLYLTLADVAKWDAALCTEKLVRRASLELAFTSGKLNSGKETGYGFGWFINRVNGHRVIEHGGAWQGFKAYIARYVDDKLAVALFVNVAGVPVERLAHAVAGLWNEALAPPAVEAIEDAEPGVTARFRALLADLAAGTGKPESFAGDFAASFFPAGADLCKERLAPLGPVTDITLVKRTEEGERRNYTYLVDFGGTVLRLQAGLNKEGVILGFGLRPE